MHKTKRERQEEAKYRKSIRDFTSTEEQLKIIRKRPGKSAKEYDRLISELIYNENYRN